MLGLVANSQAQFRTSFAIGDRHLSVVHILESRVFLTARRMVTIQWVSQDTTASSLQNNGVVSTRGRVSKTLCAQRTRQGNC